MTERRLLMIPGPIELELDVLRTLGAKTKSHVDPDFIEIFGRALERVRRVFLAPQSQPFVLAGSGTLAMEFAIQNLIEPGEHALVVDTGWFSERMARILERVGAKVTCVSAPPGDVPSVESIGSALTQQAFRLLTMTHVDTSTGVRTDARAIAELAHQHGVLSVLDGVCSVGGEEIRTEEWGIDAVLTASQKALGAPPGLAVVVFSPRAMDRYRSRRVPVGSLYLDLGEWLPIMEAYEARRASYFGTPAVNLIEALEASLAHLESEGMPERFARHARMADAFRAAFEALGLRLIATQRPLASNTISAIYLPEGVDGTLVGRVREEGVVIAGGLLPSMKSRYFRIGHMGAISSSDVVATIAALERGLIRSSHSLELGVGVRAAQEILVPR